ncbi:MAG: ORF6N domain-containing protein [Bacteroidota bacterium]
MRIIKSIQNRIYEIRGERVMIDKDLSVLYEIDVKVLNQAVKRHSKRFPRDFMFQLTKDEWEEIKFQFETLENSSSSRSQIVILKTGRGSNIKFLPYAFTDQGVAMLSGILNSDKAIAMNIAIMRAFVEIRRVLIQEGDLQEQLKQIKERIGEHDVQLNQLYDAMENLLNENIGKKKWEERERIGFK